MTKRRVVILRATVIVALGVLALMIYGPALHGGWIFDDELDLTGNALLRDRAGLWKIWFHPTGLYDYYPLKYSVQWLQWQLWGEDTFGYHLTNVALHVLSAALFWRLLDGLGAVHGWLGALLWIVHPLAVESVAWITELKNTLSLPFLLLSALCFVEFDRHGRRRDYVASMVLFLAALLCKTSVVMFPAFLIVFIWWTHGRIQRGGLVRTTPFFALSLALGLLTMWFQQHRAIGDDEAVFDPVGGLAARLACAGSSLAFYVWKFVAPLHLMTIYPQWRVEPPAWWLFLPWGVLVALAAWAWRERATWGRHALLGMAWITLNLLPVLGLLPISSQRFTWVMDHLAYVSLLGAIAFVAAGLGQWAQRATAAGRYSIFAAVGVGAMTLGVASRLHAATFGSEAALWSHNIALNPRAWMALYNLGVDAGNRGRGEESIRWYRQALAVRPAYPEAWNNLGSELRKQGRFADAVPAYEEAVRLRPRHFAAHNNLGASLAALGRTDEAIAACERSLRINPRFALAHRNLGAILASRGDNEQAVTHLDEALRLQPVFPEAARNLAEAHFNLGNATASRDPGSALRHFDRACALRPDFAEAQHNAGIVLQRLNRAADAVGRFQEAVRLKPDYVDAWLNLAATCQSLGRMSEAVGYYEAARKLRPELPPIAR